jgi:hypothetical protein
MKTSHKSDELNNSKKKRGGTNRVPMARLMKIDAASINISNLFKKKKN